MFMAPGATPRDIVNRLSAEAAKALKEAEVRERLTQTGIEPVGDTPEQAKKFLDGEIAKWAKVINTAGVKAEP
jgi:tripartite-type tricarboxylate transporter receptor subunit TctC